MVYTLLMMYCIQFTFNITVLLDYYISTIQVKWLAVKGGKFSFAFQVGIHNGVMSRENYELIYHV